MAAKLNAYIGSFADDVAADSDLTTKGYTKTIGLFYLNSTTAKIRFWDGTAWSELSAGNAPVPITSAGNPNGVVTGDFGQLCFDTTNSIWYVCDSLPNGSVWRVT